jgi:hypothetical protein
MGEACHSFTRPPCTRGRAHLESAQLAMTTPRAHPQEPQWDIGYGGGYSGHHEGSSYYPSHGYPKSSLRDRTYTAAMYAPLERYASYGAAKVEGIGHLERQMDECTDSIESQISMMHDLFGHFGINHDA